MATRAEIAKIFQEAQNRLVLQASDLSLSSIADMVATSAIDVRPEFQRRERWTNAQASALIESFLLNIPVPPVYLAEEDFGKYAVIDGKQRITAIHNFMKEKMRLTNLRRFNEIEGHEYDELPPELQNALRVRPYIRVVTLLRQSDPITKYEVFHRLNSGGEPLNAQEIRNVIYRGKLNDLTIELSKNKFLRQQLKIKDDRSNAYRTMQDVEYVLRFFTLEESWNNFGGDFRVSMDEYMEKHRNPKDSFIKRQTEIFRKSIDACESIFGDNSFKRFDRGQWRNQSLGALYDAQMISLSALAPQQISRLERHKDDIIAEYKKLFADSEFDASIRQSTNTPTRLTYRIEKTTDCLLKFV
ncbi:MULTISPECIES: DUF262 domain-containing protein [Gordonia]|uniref:DUF262 domain-containing protein n=1 Tax=Gordonia TaxID=2053 RepID=UPI0018C92DE6|nr:MULTISPECIES: DUF262 domain-containing protein [Gordonia]MDH3006489.1 DUF262 domain-containing protein [Gordonia alkanivorans]MDH3041353.1 DUF262 domain-containing protein [Gordonia alkanivorans]MDH3044035.1 DUF262 domain-containing protein [Gordonia alkanivorans]MDJ0026813.1 DUF262 domain-containing protein [Gordonia alkanivorans]